MTMHVAMVMCAAALAALAGCAAPTPAPEGLAAKAKAAPDAERPDSDAALILAEALEQSKALAPDARGTLLEAALVRAQRARDFRIAEESPLPEGWPAPSLPGLIRVKTYPPVRSAWVRSPEKRNGQFMVLFRHIQAREIPMTAPVVMEYANPAAQTPPAAAGSPEAMAFLYRSPSVGRAGQDGAVLVEDDKPLTVVSLGLKGSYRQANFDEAQAQLRQWLVAHPQWRPAGPPRVLAYNSPFMAFWRKYSEVQIPVQPAAP
ncbi:MAG: heme-binding protein [Planctomycetota bacterium]|nr:heme-binding protein [Planctomycetota bacterium]